MTDRLEELVAGSAGETRAQKLHAAALTLRETSAYARILLCEVSYVMTAAQGRHGGRPVPGLWSELRQADGTPYPTQHDYLRVLWGTSYSRSALSARKTLGKGLARFPAGQREWLRRELAQVGMVRALALAPPVLQAEDAAQLGTWLSRAADLRVSADHLRRWVGRSFEREKTHRNRPEAVCPTCRRAWKRKAVIGAVVPVAGDVVAREVAAVGGRG